MPENRKRDARGTFRQEVTDEQILRILDDHEDPFLTTPEIGDRLPITRQATLNRLEGCRKRGEVEKKLAGRTAVWWLAGEPGREKRKNDLDRISIPESIESALDSIDVPW